MNRIWTIFLLTVASLAALGEDRGRGLSGGDTTVFQDGQNAYSLPLANLDRMNRRAHVVGNSFFNKSWVPAPGAPKERDGLGPLFNATSCSACHIRDGRGRPTFDGQTSNSLLFRLGLPSPNGSNAEPMPHPTLGQQLATQGIAGVVPEGRVTIRYNPVQVRYADGSNISLRSPTYLFKPSENKSHRNETLLLGPRMAPPVFGLGLLEAIPEKTLLEFSDPEDLDRDGISGRPNRVWNSETGKNEIGRFGWKANQPTLRQQIATAFSNDLGITSTPFPKEALTQSQVNRLQDYPNGGTPEIADRILDRVLTYQRTLAPPAQRNLDSPLVRQGEKIFYQLQCHLCHRPELTTGSHLEIKALEHQTIHPFTDLLLHDMGPGVGDGKSDVLATGVEWRTPPLWGIGLTEAVNGNRFFLHDGRATSLEEAILWHGGEALNSREQFKRCHASDRSALIAFLNSL